MSSASDLSAALSAASSAATNVINEKATADRALVEATMDLNDANQHVADLQDVNDKLVVKGAEKDAEIARLQAIIDGEEPPPDPDPEPGMLVGWSMSKNPHPGECGVARIYDVSDATAGVNNIDIAVNTHKVKRIALSSRDDTKSAATVVSRIRSVLAKFPTLQVDYAHENEVDRVDHRGGSDEDIREWCAEHKVIQDAIHAAFPDGNVKSAVDFTAWNARNGISEKFLVELKRIGALPDVQAASMYPAGRKDTPPTESAMADHIDLFVDLAVKYGIRYVSCWEIGTPLSSNYDRAELVTKWVRRLRDYATSEDVVARDLIWWDQSVGIDNRFATDGSTTTVQGKTQKALLAA